MKTDSYVLRVGCDDVARLKQSDSIYGEGSRRFLQELVGPGQSVLDIGCGTGNMALWFARKVGETGGLLGIDFSLEQVDAARRLSRATGEHWARFEPGDVMSLEHLQGRFDLVYCRFLLIHLPSPLEALKQMARTLKPGGRIVCEEPDTATHRCEPPDPWFTQANDLTMALGAANGLDYCLGPKLTALFEQAHLRVIKAEAHQPEVKGADRDIFFNSFEQVSRELESRRLSDASQTHRIREGLRQLTDTQQTRVWGFRTHQICGAIHG